MPQAGQEKPACNEEQESLPRPKNGINLKLKKGDKDTYCLGRTHHWIDPSSANGKGTPIKGRGHNSKVGLLTDGRVRHSADFHYHAQDYFWMLSL